MGASALDWRPIAANLVDAMVARQVQIDGYYLFSYVDDIDSILFSNESTDLRHEVYW